MWEALGEIAARESCSLGELATRVNRGRDDMSLTGAIRAFIVSYFRAAATDAGHANAGHGVHLRRQRCANGRRRPRRSHVPLSAP